MGYTTVTEMPGTKVTRENLEMLYTRYRWALQLVEGKDVLEAACGPGQGLGYLAKKAKKVVGGDIDEQIIKCAREHYQGRVEILQFDAQSLPFENNSFDAIILFEAIYYLKSPEEFLKECRRVLKKEGVVLISTANKNWQGFNPSPYAIKYFSPPELVHLLSQYGFDTEVFGTFPAFSNSFKDKIISTIRKFAIYLRLVPKTMKGKELLKRIFYGKLYPLPQEIKEGMIGYHEPVPISPDFPNTNYKVIYFVAKIR